MSDPSPASAPAAKAAADARLALQSKSDEKPPSSSQTSSTPAAVPWRTLAVLALLLSAALFWSSRPAASVTQVDTLPESYALCSHTRDIYTVDAKDPRVGCIVVHAGRIVDTTANAEQARALDTSFAPDGLEVFHVKPGSIVVPGLADAHAHVLAYGFTSQLQLAGSQSVAEVLGRVKAYILARPDVFNDTTRWIQGMGWDQTKWDPSQFPTADDFEAEPLLRGRPIALSRVDGHASWVSNTVLETMGRLPDTVDGGAIIRDQAGNPTGIFVDNAMSLIPIPPYTEAEMEEYFYTTMRDALQHGLVSIHDADSSPAAIEFFKRKAEEGKLPLRLYLMGHLESDDYWGNKIPRLIDHGKNGRLNIRSVKLFTDGALGSWGAAMLAPYSDKPDEVGLMRSTPDALASLVKQFWRDGWQVNIHCIGDRANKVVLDIFEDLLKQKTTTGGFFSSLFGSSDRTADAKNVTTMRPRIEHAQIMQQSDLKRVGQLGVITSVQPTHATSDMWYAESRLGRERIKGAYAYQTLLQASPQDVLPLGSDFPVEGINPLLGFYAAVSRLSTGGDSPSGEDGWYPAERLTRAQALKGMTLDAAYASFAEESLGSLSPGKKADFVVLDKDIMTVPYDQIMLTKVTATVVDGELAYGAIDLTA